MTMSSRQQIFTSRKRLSTPVCPHSRWILKNIFAVVHKNAQGRTANVDFQTATLKGRTFPSAETWRFRAPLLTHDILRGPLCGKRANSFRGYGRQKPVPEPFKSFLTPSQCIKGRKPLIWRTMAGNFSRAMCRSCELRLSAIDDEESFAFSQYCENANNPS
jgi:hypothetical protein